MPGAHRSGSSRLNVVYLTHSSVLGGGELAFVSLIPALAAHGVDPLVVLSEEGPLIGRLEAGGVRVEVIPLGERTRGLRRAGLGRIPVTAAADTAAHAIRVARRVRGAGADLVHTMSLKSALYGGVAGRLARVPVVWSIQDRITDDYLPATGVRVVRLAARVLPAAIIANSRATAATMAGHGPEPVVIHPAVDVGAPVPRAPAGEGLTFGVIGRLAPWKGQHVFLDAFASAFPGGPHRARLVGAALFGEDEYVTSLHAQVERLGLTDRVEFRGFRDDVRGELAEVDVVVHCSTLPEPFGMVIPEAMAAGRVVIASAAGGPLDIVTEGHDGLLVPPDDPAALAAALRRVADDPELRDRLQASAVRRAPAFGPEPAAEATARLYRRLVRG